MTRIIWDKDKLGCRLTHKGPKKVRDAIPDGDSLGTKTKNGCHTIWRLIRDKDKNRVVMSGVDSLGTTRKWGYDTMW